VEQANTIGLDIAKHVFQVHGADAAGHVLFRKRVTRAKLIGFLATQAPCIVAMEACAGAHYWAREISKLGHRVRLIAPSYVKPFVKRQKNDAADAEAICEAAQRPSMRFVPVKTEDPRSSLPKNVRILLKLLVDTFTALEEQIAALDAEINQRSKTDPTGRRRMTIPGVGPIVATAITALVPTAQGFAAGCDFAAWLGLTPLQKSTGGKQQLGASRNAANGRSAAC
jgi:transposase